LFKNIGKNLRDAFDSELDSLELAELNELQNTTWSVELRGWEAVVAKSFPFIVLDVKMAQPQKLGR
jgi:hypothetical protein